MWLKKIFKPEYLLEKNDCIQTLVFSPTYCDTITPPHKTIFFNGKP